MGSHQCHSKNVQAHYGEFGGGLGEGWGLKSD